VGPLARPRTRQAVPHRLHPRVIPWMVRLRERLLRGYGQLQPLAHLSHSRSGSCSQYQCVRRYRRRHRGQSVPVAPLGGRLPEREHHPFRVQGHGYLLVRRRHEASPPGRARSQAGVAGVRGSFRRREGKAADRLRRRLFLRSPRYPAQRRTPPARRGIHGLRATGPVSPSSRR